MSASEATGAVVTVPEVSEAVAAAVDAVVDDAFVDDAFVDDVRGGRVAAGVSPDRPRPFDPLDWAEVDVESS
ncbi:MAG: hypothetical protein OEZ14_02310, partial [Acidimicrobiia bacterium]|nr:hypothetical protein [Acidimicrobiia bacterium]